MNKPDLNFTFSIDNLIHRFIIMSFISQVFTVKWACIEIIAIVIYPAR